jgi:predicted nucleic acid-binding protein
LPEVICNTSPLQYLHQLGRLELLRLLAGQIVVPQAVIDELAVGKASGVDVPEPLTLDWITVRQPNSIAALPLAVDLGLGEAAVLALALETSDAVVVIDDAMARHRAAAAYSE